MKSPSIPITIDNIQKVHRTRRSEIRARIGEFRSIWKAGDNDRLWEEMVFCFFTGGCSARMGLNSIEAVRHLIRNGTHEELMNTLVGRHRYPRARSRYIVESREFLLEDCDMDLRTRLSSFRDHQARRDWLAKTKGIKGLGYKEASHYLRNIGLKGYGILDKHILNCLAELELIPEPKPPSNRTRYLETEDRLRELSVLTNIDFDELDLVLWSMKTGEILK
jgi:N-glycosylase/DNA lyase